MSSIVSERLFAKFEAEFRPHVSAIGISEEIFSVPSVEISIENYINLLETTAQAGHPNIGLEIGNQAEFNDLGVFGHAIAAAETLLHALQIMSRYLITYAHDNTIRVDMSKSHLSVTYRFERTDIRHQRHDAEFALGAIFRLLSSASSRELHPVLVEFAHEKPDDITRHKQVFRCQVCFKCEHNRLHFSKPTKHWPQKTADSRLLELLESHLIEQLRVRSPDLDLVSKVRHLIASGLHEGLPSIGKISQQIGISRRSLQRQLQVHDTSFLNIQDEVRASIARDYVRNSNLKLVEIAGMLAYEEASSFTRAYKRWTGNRPFDERQESFNASGIAGS